MQTQTFSIFLDFDMNDDDEMMLLVIRRFHSIERTNYKHEHTKVDEILTIFD